MYTAAVFALFQPDLFPGYTVMALSLTAAFIIPSGFLFGLLREKLAAKISKKTAESSYAL